MTTTVTTERPVTHPQLRLREAPRKRRAVVHREALDLVFHIEPERSAFKPISPRGQDDDSQSRPAGL